MKTFKITNISSTDIPVAMATSSTSSMGVILKPGQFCVAYPQITNIIEAQERRGFIEVDRNYSNDSGLELAKAYDFTVFDKTNHQVNKYMNG